MASAANALYQQLGQLFILGFVGDRITEHSPIAYDIVQENLGGVILFDRHIATKRSRNNICNAEQVQQLTASLHSLAKTYCDGRLIVAVDQEGGKVSRFKAECGFPTTKTAAEYGLASTDATYTAARQTASMLAELGINLNFAPVADLALNPCNPIIARIGRAFSADPECVIRHCRAWITAHKEYGLATCLKHFPGHGSSSTDTHLNFTDSSTTWQKEELLPYTALIGEGIVDAVMMGHLFLRQIDTRWPASLSPEAVGLVRRIPGVNAIILSDDMQMQAITSRYGFAQACVQGLRAGLDCIIIGNNLVYNPSILRETKKHIIKSIETGLLEEEHIIHSCQHMQDFKRHLPAPARYI